MRQPDVIHVTATGYAQRSQPWYGAWRKDDRFSEQQREAMAKRGIDPETVEVIHVQREATDTEVWAPISHQRRVFAFDAPVLARLPDGRISVISPSGAPAKVLGDGWVKRPRGIFYGRSMW